MNTKQDNIIRTDYAEIMQNTWVNYGIYFYSLPFLKKREGFTAPSQ